MPNVYLDTNVYIIGILFPNSNSGIILDSLESAELVSIQSDYLIDEVISWFKRHRGKDSVGRIRTMLASIPNRRLISRHEWELSMRKWSPKVDDIDDLPHVCSYFIGDGEYFVTTNRKLTQMKISEHVRFYSPRAFVRDILKLEPVETGNDV